MSGTRFHKFIEKKTVSVETSIIIRIFINIININLKKYINAYIKKYKITNITLCLISHFNKLIH